MDRRDFMMTGWVMAALAAVPLMPSLYPTGNVQNKNNDHMNDNHIITRQSPLSVKETMDKLESILTHKNIKVYARIDQQQEADKAGIKLNGLEFIMFGNPQKGGLIMAENPAAALDLPLKVVVWENQQHQTMVTYNGIEFIKDRFLLTDDLAKVTNLEPLIDELLKS